MGASFSLDISRFVANANLKVKDAITGVAYGIAEGVIKRTPVDTGRARGNWIVTMDSMSREQTGVLDKSGERSLNRVARGLDAFELGKTRSIFLTNTLPYIVMLEYGWSPKSPAGMVRLSLLLFKGTIVRSLGV